MIRLIKQIRIRFITRITNQSACFWQQKLTLNNKFDHLNHDHQELTGNSSGRDRTLVIRDGSFRAVSRR